MQTIAVGNHMHARWFAEC